MLTESDPGRSPWLGWVFQLGWDCAGQRIVWDEADANSALRCPYSIRGRVGGGWRSKRSALPLEPCCSALPRRRPWKVAREALTIDHLSGGRTGVAGRIRTIDGLDLSRRPEVTDRKERAERLDQTLNILQRAWTGKPIFVRRSTLSDGHGGFLAPHDTAAADSNLGGGCLATTKVHGTGGALGWCDSIDLGRSFSTAHPRRDPRDIDLDT